MRAVLDENLSEVSGETLNTILSIFNPIVWRWFHRNENATVKKILFWTIKVRDLRGFVELIVGPESPRTPLFTGQ